MKYLSIKLLAWMAITTSTSLLAQQAVADKSIDNSQQFSISKIKYDEEDELTDKSFSGLYYLNIGTQGVSPIRSTDDFTPVVGNCVFPSPPGHSVNFDVNLHLPDGHRIRGIQYYYLNGEQAISGSSVYLYRMDGQGGFTTLLHIYAANKTDGIEYINRFMTDPHYVNNADGFYSLRFSANTGIWNSICSARLIMQATP